MTLGTPDYRVQAAFRSALRHFLRSSEEEARQHGITPQQHLVLLAVRGHSSYPRVTIGDVAEAMQMRHHSASLLVDRCVKRGLLNRAEDPDDRRRVMLSLTTDGQHVLEAVTSANRRELQTLDIDFLRVSVLEALELESETDPGGQC